MSVALANGAASSIKTAVLKVKKVGLPVIIFLLERTGDRHDQH